MELLYKNLGLGGFDQYQPRLDNYLGTIAGYSTNRYQLSPEQRDLVTRHWGEVIRKYGYG